MIKRIFVFLFFLFFSVLCAEDIVHVMAKGDTLYGLSKKYKVPVDSILKKNNISDVSKIKIGKKIIIPQENKKIVSVLKTYKIKKGDSLYALAKKFGVNFSSLMKLNGFTNKSILKIGTVIKIPQDSLKKNIAKKTPTKEKQNEIKKESPLKSISSKQAKTNILWPIPAKEVFYLSGKISGVVINSKKNQEVKAIASGYVVSTSPHRGFGQVVFIRTKTKYIFVYGGLAKLSVKKGDKVKVGQKLGSLGTELLTGTARLYFMVYNKNKPIDPAKAPRGS